MITCMGILVMDMFPMELGVHLAQVPLWKPICGGAPANVAVAVRRLNGVSGFIGKIGKDAFGEKLFAAVKSEGVDVSGLLYDDCARTTLNFHAKPTEEQIEFCFYRNPGADMMLRPEEVNTDLIEKSAIIHYDSLCLTDEPILSATEFAIKFAKEHGVLVSFDMNYREPLWKSPQIAIEKAINEMKYADIVKINETEAHMLVGDNDYEKAADFVLSLGAKLCCITLGSDGSYFKSREISGKIPALKVDIIDTVGCGDTFIGAVLKCIDEKNRGLDIKLNEMYEIFKFAAVASGLTATKVGVFSAMPTLSEVNDRMDYYNLCNGI